LLEREFAVLVRRVAKAEYISEGEFSATAHVCTHCEQLEVHGRIDAILVEVAKGTVDAILRNHRQSSCQPDDGDMTNNTHHASPAVETEDGEV
jgi:hypothetical protein